MPGQNDFAWSTAIVICQNELLALCTMIKCSHNLDFLASLLLCNNLTQSCEISNQFDSIFFSSKNTILPHLQAKLEKDTIIYSQYNTHSHIF